MQKSSILYRNKEKNKIIKEITKLNKTKDKITRKVKNLTILLNKDKLSFKGYEYKLNKILNNKSFNFWSEDNSNQLNKLERKLNLINSAQQNNTNIKNNYKLLLILPLLLLSIFTYFYLDPSITGLTTLDKQLTFTNSTSVDLEINVTSLRLSGYLEGAGSVKLYLGDYLVLDSTFINQTLSQIEENTTNNKSEQEQPIPTHPDTFNIQPITEEKTYFNNVCIETCDNINPSNNLNVEIEGNLIITITNSNYSIKIENITENQLQEDNLTIENQTFIIPIENISNETILEINTTIFNLTIGTSDELIQLKAELNKPVEWKLKTKNKSIELPIESTNILVEKIINESEDIKEKAKLKNLFSSTSENSSVFPEAFSQKGSKKLIEVDELNETQLEVTYYTKAPYSLETNLTEISNKLIKNITIKSDSELHYKNVLSYTDLNPEVSNTEQIKLYHYEFSNITNETENFNKSFIKIDITNNNLYNLTYEDTNNNSLIDKIYWNTLELSEQNFSIEISLTILTIQSYPTVGGNWTVLFNTTGTADLTIKAINGTTWSNYVNITVTDLTFMELKCENKIQNYQWLNDSVFIPNYFCNETASEISKVLTTGKHSLEFTFGNITKYAYNIAGILNLTLNSPLNATTTTNLSVTLNITAETNATLLKELLIYAGNSTNLDYNNILYRNVSPINLQSNNIIYNFSALPIKPDGTDGLVLLYHFDNITNFENKSQVYDWSLNKNNGTCSGSGCPTFNQSGKFGGVYNFDGNDNFDITYSFSLNINTFTFSSWVMISTTPGTFGIIGTRFDGENTFDLKVQSTLIQGDIGTGDGWLDTSADCSKTLSIGKWYNIVYAVYTNGYKSYVDGVQCSTETFSGTPLLMKSGQTMKIGISYTNENMNGQIDELAIWNRTLSDTEITNLYNLSYNKNYFWKANATDLADNVNSTGIFNLTLKQIPQIALPSSFNNTNKNVLPNLNISYQASDDGTVNNCTLYLTDANGATPPIIANQTDTSITKDVNQTFNFTTLQRGDYQYKIGCRDDDNQEGNSSLQNFSIRTYSGTLCDSGDELNICNITSSYTIPNLTSLSYNNLWIQNGGSLFISGSNYFIVNASNITLDGSGNITGNVNITSYNLTINTTSKIYSNGKGYTGASGSETGSAGGGPGGGSAGNENGGGGAGYGGYASYSSGGLAPASFYGNLTAPTNLGSGGGSDDFAGGDGGGFIFLNISDTLTVLGTITSDGENGSTTNCPGCNWGSGGGGSGGSIYIITNTITGNGTIKANGGDGGNGKGGGGGSGGRISISQFSTNTFTGNISAFGGLGGVDAGSNASSGTIVLRNSTNTHFDLIIDNNGIPLATPNSGRIISTPINYSANFNNITIMYGGYLGHEPNNTLGINITASTIYVENNGFIIADRLGFTGAAGNSTGGAGSGDGGGSRGNENGGGGGGYGSSGGSGGGGALGGSAYGNETKPTNLGSGGGSDDFAGGDGGGFIFLNISDTLTVLGTITSDGENGSTTNCPGCNWGSGGGGSGGSIYIITNTITGNGTIKANGMSGGGSSSGGGGGSGGRISIFFKKNKFSGTNTTLGGITGSAGGNAGDNGTNEGWTLVPIVGLTSPINYTNTSSQSIEFNATITTDKGNTTLVNATLFGNWSVGWHRNQTLTISGSSNNTNFTPIILGVGKYDWAVESCDAANECTLHSNFTFTIDTSIPNLTINSPLNNTNFSYGEITFNSTPEDTISILNISLFSNWTGTFITNLTNSSSTSSGSSVILKQNLTQPGQFIWSIRTCDYSNNCNSSGNMTIIIETLNLVYPSNNFLLGSNLINFTYNISNKNLIPISNCTLYLDNSNNKTDTTITTEVNQTFNITLQDKTFNWLISCIDQNNLNINSSIQIFTVDITSPNLSINSPLNSSSTANLSEILNISINDLLNITQLTIYAGNSTNLDYNSIVYINNSVYNFSLPANITYNFSVLPIKPDYTDSLILLYHFDNITNFENKTYIYDWSLNNKKGTLGNGTEFLIPVWNSSGKLGGSLEFSVYDILSSQLSNTLTNLTLSAWVRPNNSFVPRYFSLDSNGYVTDWLLIGPFTGTGCSDMNGLRNYITTAKASPFRNYTLNGSTWRERNNDQSVDLNDLFSPNDNVLAYGFAYVYSPTAQSVNVSVGSDDSIVVYVNDLNILDVNSCRGVDNDQNVNTTTLNQGWNKVLVGVAEGSGGWEFRLRFRDPTTGNPVQNLNISLNPLELISKSTSYGIGFDQKGNIVGIINGSNITGTSITASQWSHVAFTYNGSTELLYINGILSGTKIISQNYINISDIPLLIGNGFNGSIDEVAIWNRTLSQTEISNLFNLTYQKYYWKANATDQLSNVNNTAIFEFNINSQPSNPIPFIFPNPSYANLSLNASSIVTDPSGDTLTVEIVFYNNSREHFRINITNVASSSNISYTLSNNQTNKFKNKENWTASFRLNDGTVSSDFVNASILISNTQPVNITINYPLNNTNTSDNTIQIEISNGTDTDLEPITYYLEVDNNLDFSSPEYVNTTIRETINTTNDTTSALADGTYYFKIRARDDNSLNSSFTPIINITLDTAASVMSLTNRYATITSSIDINLTTNEISTCKFKNTTDSFAEMSVTNSTTHGQTISNLLVNGDYIYFVQCNDKANNTANKTILFSKTSVSYSTANTTIQNFTTNTEIPVNSTENSKVNITLITSVNATVNVVEFTNNPETTSFGSSALNKYISILADNSIKQNINVITIYIYYTDSEISLNNIDESTLRIYFFNTTLNQWIQESVGGVDQVNNFIWANVTHLSTFGIGGTALTLTSKESQKETGQKSGQPGFTEKTKILNIQQLSSGNLYQYNQLAPGINKLEIQDQNLALTSIELDISFLLNNPEITIQELNKINSIKELPDSYKYIKIEHKNLLNSAINKATFNFKLPKSKVNNKLVSLYYYDNVTWIKLDTIKIKEEGNFVYYQSKAQHLSIFAIRIYKEELKKEGIFTKEELTRTISKIKDKEINKEKILFLIAASIFIILLIGFFRYVFDEEDQKPKISKSQKVNHKMRLNKKKSKAPFLNKIRKTRKIFKRKY